MPRQPAHLAHAVVRPGHAGRVVAGLDLAGGLDQVAEWHREASGSSRRASHRRQKEHDYDDRDDAPSGPRQTRDRQQLADENDRPDDHEGEDERHADGEADEEAAPHLVPRKL